MEFGVKEHPIVGVVLSRLDEEMGMECDHDQMRVIGAYVVLVKRTLEGVLLGMVKEKKGFKPRWGFSGGGVEPGEESWETAIREVEEEASLRPDVEPDDLFLKRPLRDEESGFLAHDHFYLVEVDVETDIAPGHAGVLEAKFLTVEEIIEAHRRGNVLRKHWAVFEAVREELKI